MALWTGLGQAATVAQLVGADVGGLVSMIVQAALTARQNRSECEQLARRALMIAQLLPHVQEPEAAQPLAGLGDTLRDAHELVVSCQGRSAAYQFIMASRTAERFREVQSKIDSYLTLFPVISHIDITRRLEQIYNVLVQDGNTKDEPGHPLPQSSHLLQESSVMAQDVLPHGNQEFTLAEIVAATNDFARDTVIGRGGIGTVYRGRLHDGREVAVKCTYNKWHSQSLEEEFQKERDILSRLRHRHIIRLLGSCMTVSKDKRLLTTPQKKKKGILTISRQRKEPKEPEGLFFKREEPEGLILVYEYMENGTLFDHLHSGKAGSSALLRVTMSWKTRVDVLLGVSHAIEHLHYHANPPIIHRDIKSANILFDASWVPRLSDFGSSVVWDMANEEEGMELPVIGTFGYLAPEYSYYGNLKPASDVYSLGVVMLEVLTGKKAFFQGVEEMNTDLVSFAVPIIEADNTEELLDRRPVPEPMPWRLQALKRVAHIARCCVKFYWKDRPAISDIVANLKMAHTLICRDEPSPVDESGLWPFLAKVDESGSLNKLEDLPCPSSVPTPGYQSDLIKSKPTLWLQYDKQILSTGSKAPLPLQYLKYITNNFSDEQILGKGGFGVVYKGVLGNGETVAVKKLLHAMPSSEKQFENEVNLLMKLEHPNIVRLVGYCYETQRLHTAHEGKSVFVWHTDSLLCLECLPKGSLDKYISDASSGLDWHTRCKIIEGISYGLQYLHEHSNEPIIHLDLKPANILLDVNMGPKITDFGLSRLFDQTQTIHTASTNGTLGYMPPEFLRGIITPMWDIFSLGVIIMEVITGHRDYPYDIRKSSEEFIERELQNWRNRLQTDPGYTSLETDCTQIERYIQIGLVCVNPERTKRPKMKKIVHMLQGLESMNWYITNELWRPLSKR